MADLIRDTALQMHWAEVGAVMAGLIYVLLAAREQIWCWFFGIVGSALSIYLFVESKLYAEAFLYLYYVLAGFYGWYAWSHAREQGGAPQVIRWAPAAHALSIGITWLLALLLAVGLKRYTDAQMPLLDAHTTLFSFLATYLATRKVLGNWLYWIAIDAASIYLYFNRALYLYALLMLLYTALAVYGYRTWLAHYRAAAGQEGAPPGPGDYTGVESEKNRQA